MNDETMNALSALAGVTQPADNGGGEATDWKAKYEEAQKQLASARVEQGRVKKLAEENKALAAKLAEQDSSRRVQAVMDSLPDDLKDALPEDYAKGAAALAQRTVDAALAARDAELAQLKAQNAEAESRQFGAQINREFPGFLQSAVLEGGDKHAAWVRYQRYNAASINAAVNACDFESLKYHIEQFYRNELGMEPPSGGTGAAAPDPSAISGGQPVAVRPGKTYTWDEIDKLYDEIERLRARGDREGMKRLSDEVERAQREGRVK